MRNRGVETVFYYQVDNPLIRIAHPEFLGFHLAARAEMSCKVLRKPDPDVRWGVFARMGGRLAIVEYTELDEGMRHARDSSGELVYWAGSPAIHLFEVEFLERVAARANALLPLHASAKKLARVDELGQPLHSPAPNGYKLERFVFDALPAASRAILLEVRASEEFSPVKNAEGSESPASARRDLQREYWRWLSEGGVELPSGAGEQQSAESSDECIDPQIGLQIELNHAAVDGPDDVVALGWRSLDEAQLAALIKPGKQA
jgi:UDP-N-acetylglucosamine/UDP-N-acetylgalactosamine diphosphorylase